MYKTNEHLQTQLEKDFETTKLQNVTTRHKVCKRNFEHNLRKKSKPSNNVQMKHIMKTN